MLIETEKGKIPYHRIIWCDDIEIEYEVCAGKQARATLTDRGVDQLATIGKRWLEVLDQGGTPCLIPMANVTLVLARQQGEHRFFEVRTSDGGCYYADRVTHKAIWERSIEVYDFGEVPDSGP